MPLLSGEVDGILLLMQVDEVAARSGFNPKIDRVDSGMRKLVRIFVELAEDAAARDRSREGQVFTVELDGEPAPEIFTVEGDGAGGEIDEGLARGCEEERRLLGDCEKLNVGLCRQGCSPDSE